MLILVTISQNVRWNSGKRPEQKGIDTTDVDLSDNRSEYEMESR